MKEARIVVATFADLGRKNNLKTKNIFPVIDNLSKNHKLKRVICRINTSFSFKETKSAISLMGHYFLKIVELFIPRGYLLIRRLEEKILDNLTAKNISEGDIVLFYPEYFFKKSIKKAKEIGAITVGIASMAHPATNASLEKEEFSLFKIPENHKKYRFYEKLQKKYADLRFDYLIALSDFVKISYKENGFPENKIVTINSNSGIFPKEIHQNRDDIFRVIYVAFTNPLKGLHYLLETWDKLNLNNAELMIVGGFVNLPKEFSGYYRKIIESNKSIKIVGTISPNKMIELYMSSSALVLPSLTEGNPRVIMEAMACGLPIITTENAKSIVINNVSGFIVPTRDKEILLEKIEFLYQNRENAVSMGAKARESIEKMPIFHQKVINFLDEIAKKH